MYDLRATAFERRVRRNLLIVENFSTHPLFISADLPSRGAGALPLTRRALQHEAQRRGASLRLVKGEERNSNIRPLSGFQGSISDFFWGGGGELCNQEGAADRVAAGAGCEAPASTASHATIPCIPPGLGTSPNTPGSRAAPWPPGTLRCLLALRSRRREEPRRGWERMEPARPAVPWQPLPSCIPRCFPFCVLKLIIQRRAGTKKRLPAPVPQVSGKKGLPGVSRGEQE